MSKQERDREKNEKGQKTKPFRDWRRTFFKHLMFWCCFFMKHDKKTKQYNKEAKKEAKKTNYPKKE